MNSKRLAPNSAQTSTPRAACTLARVAGPIAPSGAAPTASCSQRAALPTPAFTAASNTSSASGGGSLSPATRSQ